MTVSRVCYCNREEVQRAVDFMDTVITNAQIDRAMEAAAETIEGELHRTFYPIDTTYYWDWPNYQFAAPWKLYVDQWDIIALTAIASPPGTSISLNDIYLYPLNRKPGWPYTKLELNRSTSAAFSGGPTPQSSISLTGTFGFTNDQLGAGTLAAAISSGSASSCVVSDGSQMGAGDLIVIDSERMVVADKTSASTGLTQTGSGCTTASNADDALATTGSGAINAGEVILLDTEKMLVTDVTAGIATVKRAWDGTVLATHSGAAVYAYRTLSVLRGQYGTAAAGHSNGEAVTRLRVPQKVRSLGVAESVNQVLQETSGYARTVGAGPDAAPAPGEALAELWDEATTLYGRKARRRAV